MVGDLLRDFEFAAVLQIRRDAGRAVICFYEGDYDDSATAFTDAKSSHRHLFSLAPTAGNSR
jgi:hypothetical protein